MGTRSVIAIPDGNGWKGRYCHWDGYPTHMGFELIQIVRRDGLDLASQVLCTDHTGWSTISCETPEIEGVTVDPEKKYYDYPHGSAEHYAAQWKSDERFRPVAGYGVLNEDGIGKDHWITPDGGNWGTEWCYVLSPKGMIVVEATPESWPHRHSVGMFGMNLGACWRFKALVPWDTRDVLPLLELIEDGEYVQEELA